MSMIFHCTELRLSKKQIVKFDFLPPTMFIFLVCNKNGSFPSEDLPAHKIS
jgi:hypothetical protein